MLYLNGVNMQGNESAGRNVVIGHSSPGGIDCMDVATVDGSESMEYVVQLDCSYDETSVTVCVRYTTGRCSSMETRRIALGEFMHVHIIGWPVVSFVVVLFSVNVEDAVCPPSSSTPTLSGIMELYGCMLLYLVIGASLSKHHSKDLLYVSYVLLHFGVDMIYFACRYVARAGLNRICKGRLQCMP